MTTNAFNEVIAQLRAARAELQHDNDAAELKAAHDRAQKISDEYQCSQHVNRRGVDGSLYVSDWYDCDSTIASYSSGRRLD